MAREPEEIRREIGGTRAEMGETVEAITYKTDVKTRASDWVSDKKDAVTGKVRGATPDTEAVKGQAQRGARVARENPLGLALAGVAVGFLAGLLVPSTRVEDERIGDLAEDVKERAKETGREAVERGKQVAQEAGASAAETARERGGEHQEEMQETLKESAQDVASRTSPTSGA